MDKKGSIGTGLTWIVAFPIILVMLIIFVIISVFLSGGGISSEALEISEVKIKDFSVTKNIIFMLENNQEVISNWVDDEKYGDDGDYPKVCKIFKDMETFDLKSGFIYFEVNNPETLLVPKTKIHRKTLKIEILSGENKQSCDPSLREFFIPSQIFSKVPFSSDKGNLVEVSYVKK